MVHELTTQSINFPTALLTKQQINCLIKKDSINKEPR
jgi:hypothetical protein